MKFNSLNAKKNLILFSTFIFIFWINQKVNAEEIKLNELDKRLEKISEISDKTFDFVSSKGFFTADKEEKKEEKPIDDLVIYITSPRSIQSNEGFFQIHISSFNPIREIRINEENYKIDNSKL